MILAVALLAGATFGMKAADNVDLPEAGDFSVEVQFNPFSNDFETFGLDNMKLKGRYFFSNADALRIGLGFGVDSNKKTPQPDGEGLMKDINSTERIGNFAIDLGYERHLVQKGRIDLYAGAGLGFALQSSCNTNKFVDVNDNGTEVLRTEKEYNTNSYTMFNVNIFSGVDFYLYKGLYVGAELGVKVGFKTIPGSYTKGGYTTDGNWSDSIESDKTGKATNLNLATYVVPALRLGWTF